MDLTQSLTPLTQDTDWKQLSLIYAASAVRDTAITDCRRSYGHNRVVIIPVTNVSDTTIELHCLSQILGSLRSIHRLYEWGFPRKIHWFSI